jgi:hypothetical protein
MPLPVNLIPTLTAPVARAVQTYIAAPSEPNGDAILAELRTALQLAYAQGQSDALEASGKDLSK